MKRRNLLIFALILSMVPFAACSGDTPETPQAVFQSYKQFLRVQRFEEASELIWPETLEIVKSDLGSQDLDRLFSITRVNSLFLLDRMRIDGEMPENPEIGEEITMDVTYRDGREAQVSFRWGGDRWFIDLPLNGEEFDLVQPVQTKEDLPAPESDEVDDEAELNHFDEVETENE